jgi:cytochrome P450
MFGFAIKTVLLAVFGETFEDNDAVTGIKNSYDYVWGCLEAQLKGEILEEGSEKKERFKKEYNNIRSIMKDVLNKATYNVANDPNNNNFLDVIAKLDFSFEEKSADMVAVFVASFHTTGLLLTWCLYYPGLPLLNFRISFHCL